MRIPPWLTLLVLAPVLGEMVCGSSPPSRFFNPVGLPMMLILYGGGALLAREYTRLWGKGWRTLLLLGVAYAILEEGLMCKSFFDPHWPDVGRLGVYGRWLGVNWVWTFFLTLYHTFYSIGLSVLLAELFHPAQRAALWLRPWSRRLLLALLALDVWAGYSLLPDPRHAYRPPALLYLLACGGVVLLIVLARRVPATEPVVPVAKRLPPWRFGLIGFLAALGFFPLMNGAPGSRWPAGLYLLLMAGLAFWILRKVWRHSGGGHAWDDRHRAALAAGVLLVMALWDFLLQSLGAQGAKDLAGMGLVGLGVLLLAWQAVRASRRTASEPPPVSSAPAPG